jgi:hypothetical protein
MNKRIGRWAYYSHPHNGPVWRLDGTTLDLEHDPHNHSVCIGGQCNGAWVLYRDGRYSGPISEHLSGYGGAMWQVEQMHDEEQRAALTIEGITHGELADALTVLAERTGNGDAYFPYLATCIFEHVESERAIAALAAIGEGVRR